MTEFELRERLTHCIELEYILLGDLRDLLEEAPSKETSRWLTAVLDVLLEKIPEEFEMRCEDGYLQSVIDKEPNWEPLVQRLQEQHFTMFRSLKAFRDRLRSGDIEVVSAESLKLSLGEWIESFTNHRRSEQRLVLMATHVDVGWGG
ncbi:MAG: hypothetical protein KDA88_22150 [Planctomycetaceae bacterium]|nr:hypothetical protein [Planctomycetaceae bacterium]MCB9949654.1 hypothetical protein [Planctomycetaceae bacterium]